MTTPTQELILEVLAARYRLGETWWTFEKRTLKAARGLADLGLIEILHGIVENTYRAQLTDAGRQRSISWNYQAPLLQRYEDLLGSIWLYIKWVYVTRQLRTADKELFADAVDAWNARLHDDDPGHAQRWWRD